MSKVHFKQKEDTPVYQSEEQEYVETRPYDNIPKVMLSEITDVTHSDVRLTKTDLLKMNYNLEKYRSESVEPKNESVKVQKVKTEGKKSKEYYLPNVES